MHQRRLSVRSAALLVATASLPLLAGGEVRADELLIRETESLRNALSLSDPSRLPLTLRLADLLMDEASRAGAAKPKLQARALALYNEALQEPIRGAARIRIEFQRARLMSDLGQVDRAAGIWKELAEQRELAEVSREAALRLAETFDVPGAAKWYQQALDLCQGGDLCSYIRFKRAWIFRQEARGGVADDRAIAEMELALFDSKGQIREESLRDYLVFLGEMPAEQPAARAAQEQPAARAAQEQPAARAALAKIEALAQKLDRRALVADLAEAYFAAGNKSAGTFVLAQAERAEPRFARLARLAEEQYGLRDWDAFAASLDELTGGRGAALLAQAPDADRVEGEKFLRRLVIQLDGERISQPARLADFQKASLGYIALFPASPEKGKFQEGWIASEPDAQKKIDQLARWIALEPQSVKLREFRAGFAQKAGMSAIVASEMAALAAIPAAGAKSREYRYGQARALYEAKDFASALPLFVSLSQVESGSQPDSWAVQAQNLALDILNQGRNWDGIVARAGSWLDAEWTKSASAPVKKELAEMAVVRDQARFERAVALGETPAALAQFLEFCRAGTLSEKSCENARVLSVKLRDQESLLAVLELLGPSKNTELAQELEASGEFARAAKILEQLAVASKSKDATGALKIALLRELSGDAPAFARAVEAIRAMHSGLNEKQEALWLSMAMDLAPGSDAFPQVSTLKLLRSEGQRERLAEWLESRGLGGAETRAVLLSAKFQTGKAWEKLVLGQMAAEIAASRKITFYGRNSRSQFEKRLAATKTVAGHADAFFPKCEPATKSELATLMRQAYLDLASEIRNSPIPEGVPEEAIAELKQGIEQMAAPFDEKAAVYAQVILPAAPSAAPAAAVDQIALTSAHADSTPAAMPKAAPAPAEIITQALATLRREPESVVALQTLRDSYRALGKTRLAGYFEGRLNAAGGRK